MLRAVFLAAVQGADRLLARCRMVNILPVLSFKAPSATFSAEEYSSLSLGGLSMLCFGVGNSVLVILLWVSTNTGDTSTGLHL